MKEKKILFKYDNGGKTFEIKNVNQEELLVFICETLESLIQKNIVTRDIMLTSINLCLTVLALYQQKQHNLLLGHLLEHV